MKDIALWSYVATNIAAWSIVLPLAAGLFRYKRLDSVAKIVFFFVIVSGISEFITTYMANQNMDTASIFPYWVAVETLFLSAIFRRVLFGIWKKIVLVVLAVVLLTSTASIFIWADSDAFSSNLRLLETAVFIVLCLVYFYQLFDRGEVKVMGREPMFWFGTAFFLYFCGNLFFVIATNTSVELTNEQIEFLQGIWIINAIVMVIRNVLLTIGFWRITRKWT